MVKQSTHNRLSLGSIPSEPTITPLLKNKIIELVINKLTRGIKWQHTNVNVE
jgi:hypothetical protein